MPRRVHSLSTVAAVAAASAERCEWMLRPQQSNAVIAGLLQMCKHCSIVRNRHNWRLYYAWLVSGKFMILPIDFVFFTSQFTTLAVVGRRMDCTILTTCRSIYNSIRVKNRLLEKKLILWVG